MQALLYFLILSCLFLPKGSAGCLPTVTSPAALDIHMVRMTLVVGVVDTFHRLTVYADGLTGVAQGALEGILPFSFLDEAVTACPFTVTCMLTAYHDIPLAAQALLVIGTIFHCTFQICHNISLLLHRFPCRSAASGAKQQNRTGERDCPFLVP